MKSFTPPKGLKNKHLQSILSSTGPRQFFEKRRCKALINSSIPEIIVTPQNIKLAGCLSKTTKPRKGIAILLHGWEGCTESLYMLSTGQAFLDDGYDVFRLNFRDHGGTQHLNEGLFNSMLLEEVLEAVKYLAAKYGGQHNVLCGYSLGGNFCLRIANLAVAKELNIDQAIAVCPLLDPPTTMEALSNGLFIYEQYFVKRWKSSLSRKLNYHSYLDYKGKLNELKSLQQMNDFFIVNYTEFNTVNEYLKAYSLLGDALQTLSIPTTIISTEDDPMIPASQLSQLYPSPFLSFDLQASGGHCAFIKNWKLESWVNERIIYHVQQQFISS